jgi:hypothetical protein
MASRRATASPTTPEPTTTASSQSLIPENWRQPADLVKPVAVRLAAPTGKRGNSSESNWGGANVRAVKAGGGQTAMSEKGPPDKPAPAPTASGEVAAFLKQVAALPNARPAGGLGRLLFGVDATASRQPTWDTACQIQSEMFRETASLGGLEVQLVYYRGFHEMKATPWVADSNRLAAIMGRVQCLGGQTQVGRLLRYAIAETKRQRIDALVFIGDCLEEGVDDVTHLAGELGLLGVPCFMFHEGADATAMLGFRQIATLTRGAYCRFDAGSAAQLRQLLAAVAVYAAGGRKALADFSRREGGATLLLAQQIKPA